MRCAWTATNCSAWASWLAWACASRGAKVEAAKAPPIASATAMAAWVRGGLNLRRVITFQMSTRWSGAGWNRAGWSGIGGDWLGGSRFSLGRGRNLWRRSEIWQLAHIFLAVAARDRDLTGPPLRIDRPYRGVGIGECAVHLLQLVVGAGPLGDGAHASPHVAKDGAQPADQEAERIGEDVDEPARAVAQAARPRQRHEDVGARPHRVATQGLAKVGLVLFDPDPAGHIDQARDPDGRIDHEPCGRLARGLEPPLPDVVGDRPRFVEIADRVVQPGSDRGRDDSDIGADGRGYGGAIHGPSHAIGGVIGPRPGIGDQSGCAVRDRSGRRRAWSRRIRKTLSFRAPGRLGRILGWRRLRYRGPSGRDQNRCQGRGQKRLADPSS